MMLKKLIILILMSTQVVTGTCKEAITRCKECKEDQIKCISCKNNGDWLYNESCYECSQNYMCKICEQNTGCKECRIGFKIFQKDNLNFCQKKEQNCNPGNQRCQFCERKEACTICKDPTDYKDKGICKVCSGLSQCSRCDLTGCSQCKEGSKVKREEGNVSVCLDMADDSSTGFHIYLLVTIAGVVVLALIVIIVGYLYWKSRMRSKGLIKKSQFYTSDVVDMDSDIF